MRQTCRSLGWIILAAGFVSAHAADNGKPAGGTENSDATASLRAALVANLDYCAEWLAGKDFKTLAQTASGLEILGHTLSAKSDDANWQKAVASFLASAGKLKSAAGKQDVETSSALIEEMRKQAAALPPAAGNPRTQPRGKGSMRDMMALLEGTLADAKTNVAVGDLENARITADVLKELGLALSNYRQGDGWSAWSRQFAEAAEQAANYPDKDAKGLRAQLKSVHEACENCHDKR